MVILVIALTFVFTVVSAREITVPGDFQTVESVTKREDGVFEVKTGSGTHEHCGVMGQIDVAFGQPQNGAGLDGLRKWSTELGLHGLSELGLRLADHADVARAAADASSMKGNPFQLSQNELLEILGSAS